MNKSKVNVDHELFTIERRVYLHHRTRMLKPFISQLPSPLTCIISSRQETVSINANPLGREAVPCVQIPARGFDKQQYWEKTDFHASGDYLSEVNGRMSTLPISDFGQVKARR